MGTNAVGAFIVSGPDGFEKGQYRKFNIETAKPGDDFGMMTEVLTRRFTRLLGVGFPPAPSESQISVRRSCSWAW